MPTDSAVNQPTPEAAARQAGRRKRRRRFNAIMRPVRRVHMYLGLFMLPWMLVYGVSALLFNHPDLLADPRVVTIGPADVASTPLASIPTASDLAGQIVAEMNGVGFKDDTGRAMTFTLADPGRARFDNWFLFDVDADGLRHRVRVDPATGTGVIRIQQPRPEKTLAPFTVLSGLRLDEPIVDRMSEGVSAVARSKGVAVEEPAVLRGRASIEFEVSDGERSWLVTYDLRRGSLTGRPADVSPRPASLRKFLTDLHSAHAYPPSRSVRWAWALLVDAMAIVMILWAASGLLMWWQMKPVRLLGGATLLACVVVAIWLGLGMMGVLAG